MTVFYLYDEDGDLIRKIIRDADGTEQTYRYTNPENGNPVVTLPTGVVSQSGNDKFGRKEYDELQLGRAFMYRRFTYHDGNITGRNRLSENLKSTPTTNLVKEITLENGRTLAYEYDEEERITKVTDSVDGETVYEYDAQGQLLTEQVTPVGSTQATRSMSMTYDNYGNIQTKTTNGVTNTYEYNCTWKDKLTAVNGVPIVYDNLGNPISYLGNTLSWEKGRQLKQFTKADGTIISYTYNANGIRTSKTVGGVQHTYALDGTKILKETWGDCTLIPLYDNEDSVCGIMYDDAAYYFHKNLQGDIIEIKNAYGACVARYTYDAWGKVIAITDEDGLDVSDNAAHVANANPFRYRGYYYDAEIGMYYLQSRYYDPGVGRFVNGDDVNFLVASANNNVYSYCNNNPCNMNDEFGYISISLKQYRNKNWLTKLAYRILPSVYIGGYSKEIPIINMYCLKLDIAYTFFSLQTSASAYLGFLLDKEKVEMSAFIPIWGSWPFIGSWAAAFSIGASWTYTYICIAILYSCGDYLYAGIGLKLSVSNLALAAVSLACLAVPYLNAFYVKCMTLVANAKRAAATLGAIVTIASKLCPSC